MPVKVVSLKQMQQKFKFQLVEPPFGSGYYSHGLHDIMEKRIFCGLAQKYATGRAFVLGTWWQIDSDWIRVVSPGCEVWTIDNRNHRGKRPKHFPPRDPKVKFIQAGSQNFDFPQKLFRSFSFVFVDGSDSMPMVANDIRLAKDLAKPGGLIVVHDVRLPERPGQPKHRPIPASKFAEYTYLNKWMGQEVWMVAGTCLGVWLCG